MSGEGRRSRPDAVPPAHRVSVLTEVIGRETTTADVAPPGAGPLDDELAQRVLVQVQRQVDVLLEQRVREAVGAALARLADTLVQEARVELASALREIVAAAVARERARHPGPQRPR